MALVAPYDTTGALGGLFSPAYVHGDPQSEAAVQTWMQGRGATNDQINASKDAAGHVDQNALQAAAQFLPYDLNARRNAIAAQVQANQQAAAQQQQAAPAQQQLPVYGQYGTPAVGGYPINWLNSDVPNASS